jgi:hypothetical protein
LFSGLANSAPPVAGDGEINGHSNLATVPERQAVDRGDGRLVEGFQVRGMACPRRTKSRSAAFVPRVAGGELMDIGARGERALAGSGEDDGARIVIDLDRIKRGHQAVDQVVAERVEPVRPVRRDRSAPSSISRRMASDILSLQAYWRSLSP